MGRIISIILDFLRKFAPEIFFGFLNLVVSLLVPFISKAASVLGLTTVTLYGIHALEVALSDNVLAYFDSLPADVLAMVGIVKLDIAFSLISSAVVVKHTLDGWKESNDSISHTTLIPPPSSGE
jgi:hypothetical protein